MRALPQQSPVSCAVSVEPQCAETSTTSEQTTENLKNIPLILHFLCGEILIYFYFCKMLYVCIYSTVLLNSTSMAESG